MRRAASFGAIFAAAWLGAAFLPSSTVRLSLDTILFSTDWVPHYRTSEIYALKASGGRLRNLTNDAVDEYDPAWSPDGKTVAFARGRNGKTDLFLMDADGTSVRSLTTGRNGDREPRWSPDGKTIAFVRPAAGWDQIFTIGLAGGAPRQLTNEEAGAGDPAWSPDGASIAGTGGFDSDGSAIFVMRRDGTGLRYLPPGGVDAPSEGAPAWSPDGTKLAFTRVVPDFEASGVWVMDATGAHRRPIAKWGQSPQWSPDGSRIAFIRGPRWQCDPDGCYDPGLLSVSVVRPDGGGLHDLTRPVPRLGGTLEAAPADRWLSSEGATFFGVSWAPDGTTLLFARRLELRPPNVFSIRGDGRRLHRITSGSNYDFDAKLSPDRRRMLFLRWRGRYPAIYAARADGSRLRLIAHGYSPAWSPDGRTIVFSRAGDLLLVSLRGGKARRILHRRNTYFDSPAWAPDGRRLVVSLSTRRAGAHLVVVSTGGTIVRAFPSVRSASDVDASWSPDGRTIAFARYRINDARDRSAIFVVSAEGDRARRLTRSWRDRDRFPAWSSDGRRLAFASRRDGDWDVYVMTADGSHVRAVTHNLADDVAPDW